MKNLIIVVLGLFVGLNSYPDEWMSQPEAKPRVEEKIISSGPIIEKIRRLSELVSLEVQVADVLSQEKRGWFAGYKAAWIIKGNAVYSTDLSNAKIKVLDDSEANRRVRVELPLPQVSRCRVNHETSRTYDLRSNAFIPLWGAPEEIRDEAMRKAQRLVRETASSSDLEQQAKDKVTQVLGSFCEALGYELELAWTGKIRPSGGQKSAEAAS